MIVWVVTHNWKEEIEEYVTWHCDLHAIFSTEELAKEYVKQQPYQEDSGFGCGSMEVREELPKEHITTEQEFMKLWSSL